MSDTETIHVADVSKGVGGDATSEPGSSVDLPVVELLTGRGFVTGKSGSGKSNTASVLIENLLDNNFPVLIVDTDGEYYGLKEEYEILHAGADEECDIVVSPEHAEKIASLALEQNVPIILDVSGYLEESEASKLLLEVTKQLFAKEKKLKKPFLLVLEECHEYIPEGGGMDETGKILIKVGKRGRKHGLGIVGISQRPADVKKDFITQCDWLCWHRLTWDNDTKVVGRILGSKYADAIEELADGEAFLMTDWDESIRRIQFHRKQTFDAGATPGLEDFERPELKSVSGDLVSELQSISDEQARHESEMADLRQELDKKRARINQLEAELEEAKDLSNMADQFAQALLGKAEAPYRGGGGRNVQGPTQAGAGGADAADGGQSDLGAYEEPEGNVTNEHAGESNEATSTARGEETDDEPGAEDADETTTADDLSADDLSVDDPSADDPSADDPAADVEPVTRADVAEGALRFDDAMELGTRAAVIDELAGRVEALPDLSQAMLRHYRREGVSEPIAAHIDAGGDGDSGHAYSRHRPIRKAGLIRHAGRGHYAYAIPELVREAYADRLDDEAVREMVAEIEETFVPPAERVYPADADPESVAPDVARDAVAEDVVVDGSSSDEANASGDSSDVASESVADEDSNDHDEDSSADTDTQNDDALILDAGEDDDADDSSSTGGGLSDAAKGFAGDEPSDGTGVVDEPSVESEPSDDDGSEPGDEVDDPTVLDPDDDAEIIDDVGF
ncbi:hypothetical protein JCM17823_03710 [Halorubrum gandharaense]